MKKREPNSLNVEPELWKGQDRSSKTRNFRSRANHVLASPAVRPPLLNREVIDLGSEV